MRYLILFIFGISNLYSQEIFTYSSFKDQLRLNHPLAKAADIKIASADMELMNAKAAFDPVLQFENSQKTLNEKTYYNYSVTELVYQSPYAVKLKAGFERTKGGFINPEATPGSLGFLGIELPILRGLLTDYKRLGIQKAKIGLGLSEIERKRILNDLYTEADYAYFNWAQAHQKWQILRKFKIRAAERLALNIKLFQQGERAALDTLEASIQYDRIKLKEVDAELNYYGVGLNLSKFLWTAETEPYLLPKTYLPDTLTFASFSINTEKEFYLKKIPETNLDLLEIAQERKLLNFEKSYYRQFFLPELNLKANVLDQKNLSPEIIFAQPANENYKIGFTFNLPILQREARSKNKLNALKQQSLSFKNLEKNNALKTKILAYDTEIQNLERQFDVYSLLDKKYHKIYDLENSRFKMGESTQFVIVNRENQILDNLEKLLDLRLKIIYKKLEMRNISGFFE